MSVKVLDVPVHKARILLCNSRRDAVKLVRDVMYKDPLERQESIELLKKASAASFESDGPVDWLFLYSRKKPQDVAHEAVHIGIMVLADLGIAITQENDETLAYLVDHIVEAFFDKTGWVPLEEFLASEKPVKRAKK